MSFNKNLATFTNKLGFTNTTLGIKKALALLRYGIPTDRFSEADLAELKQTPTTEFSILDYYYYMVAFVPGIKESKDIRLVNPVRQIEMDDINRKIKNFTNSEFRALGIWLTALRRHVAKNNLNIDETKLKIDFEHWHRVNELCFDMTLIGNFFGAIKQHSVSFFAKTDIATKELMEFIQENFLSGGIQKSILSSVAGFVKKYMTEHRDM